MIMLVPAAWICASIEDCAPVPSATIVMTAATPMIMPSMVSAVRILLRLSALSAIRKIIKIDMALLTTAVRGGRQRRQFVLGAAAGLRRPARSATTCPSRNVTMRVPYSAMSISCVISTTVMPRSWFRRWKMPITSMLVRVSRLPVGSSASRIDGLLISARAIATRCC